MATTVASANLTNQSASIASTTLYSVPVGQAGQYRLSWNAKVTRAATSGCSLGVVQITYQDPDGNTIPLVLGANGNLGTNV